MISDVEGYHGVVLRQLLITHGQPLRIGVADMTGRIDAFSVEESAFQIKHSSKRLSPWQFTYMPEVVAELKSLAQRFDPVWVFLVCGHDGVVGLSLQELVSIAIADVSRGGWVRVGRSRHSMYRVNGPGGELPRAKARGVDEFLLAACRTRAEGA